MDTILQRLLKQILIRNVPGYFRFVIMIIRGEVAGKKKQLRFFSTSGSHAYSLALAVKIPSGHEMFSFCYHDYFGGRFWEEIVTRNVPGYFRLLS